MNANAKISPDFERIRGLLFFDPFSTTPPNGGGGKENSREKNMLAVSTLRRAVKDGNFGVSPKKKGRSARVSRNWMELVAVHINVTQVSTVGEADIATIKATIRASVMGTEHDGSFNLTHAWREIRRLNADTLVPSGHLGAEDIRWSWCTLDNIKQHQDHYIAALCKYGFATNEPSTMPDGTVIPYTFLPDMRVRSNHMDESHHPLDNSHDEGGTRATTYVNHSLNHSRSRTTRSGPHVTGCYSVNLSGQVNPPLFIYTSKEQSQGPTSQCQLG
eukprot:scaffold32561_cov32-Cyclotella_meneghiniana.AAC.2